jgi:oxalate decarboxylase/phosphoglucose isomerase-like protein (cupin superfamily)
LGTYRYSVEFRADAVALYVEAGIPHLFRNTGDAPMTILWIYDTDFVTRTFVATGRTVEHLSADDRMVED